ncbi:hypothetical protein GCM10025791_43760 [Halioxenophilus aromaticivorans]|uniref:Uncharacterized protein n=1 Tax=Halioxenophilus aromaticivorans TaxID=1306992 RepID=A0AAV3U909_9ALTE
MNKPIFNEANFVPVPRVPEWQIYQPEKLPHSWRLMAQCTDSTFLEEPVDWLFYFDGAILVIYRHKDRMNRFNGEPI